MNCRHCHTRPVNRPLGLCWSCYYTPGVRALYPSVSKFAAAADGRVNLWPTCPSCGLPVAVHQDRRRPAIVCDTCRRPEVARQGYRDRIALYAVRAATSRPLFDSED